MRPWRSGNLATTSNHPYCVRVHSRGKLLCPAERSLQKSKPVTGRDGEGRSTDGQRTEWPGELDESDEDEPLCDASASASRRRSSAYR